MLIKPKSSFCSVCKQDFSDYLNVNLITTLAYKAFRPHIKITILPQKIKNWWIDHKLSENKKNHWKKKKFYPLCISSRKEEEG